MSAFPGGSEHRGACCPPKCSGGRWVHTSAAGVGFKGCTPALASGHELHQRAPRGVRREMLHLMLLRPNFQTALQRALQADAPTFCREIKAERNGSGRALSCGDSSARDTCSRGGGC